MVAYQEPRLKLPNDAFAKRRMGSLLTPGEEAGTGNSSGAGQSRHLWCWFSLHRPRVTSSIIRWKRIRCYNKLFP